MKYQPLIFKIIFPLLLFYLLFYCERTKTPIEPLIEKWILEYEITAAEGGIFHKTYIDENGAVYFIHFINGNGNYEIYTSLPRQKYNSLTKILLENDF